MATIKGLMADGLDYIKAKAADSAKAVGDFSSGMRGQSVVPYDPVRGQAFGPPNSPPDIGAATNPNVGPGRPSPEASAWRAQQAAQPKPGMMQRMGGGVRGMLRSAGPAAAAYGGVYAAQDAARKGNTDEDYATAEKLTPDALGVGLRHDIMPVVAGGVGAVRRVGEAFGFGQPAQAAAKPNQLQPVGDMPSAVPAAQPQADNMIDTTRGLRVSPDELMRGNQVPVSGQGAFQRTTPGNRGVATKVGARTDEVKPAGSALPKATGLAGHMVNLSALGLQAKAAAAKEHGAAVEASLGIKAATAGAAIRKSNQEFDQSNRKQIQEQSDAYVDSQIGKLIKPQDAGTMGLGGEKPADFKARIDQEKADFKRRADYSVANRRDGKKLEDLNPQEFQQLTLLDSLRRKTEAGRGEVTQQLRDFFGNKQFNSNDLYSYAPKNLEASLLPGAGAYHVKLANGNTVNVTRAAGGDWVVGGTNTVVDSDIMGLIQHAAAQKGKK